MGRALAPVAAAASIERYEPAAFNPFVASDPFVASGLHYGVRRRDKQVVHREWAANPEGKVLAETEAEVQFAVGSAIHGRAYLVNHDGYLFQSPITWYPQGKRWDLSPGYELRNQHFSRPITPACLFCHCNQAELVPGTVNRYCQPLFLGSAISCERCHGPGELHVQRRTSREVVAGLDDTIVNPARLEHSLREAVCQQCHLQGEQRVVRRGRTDFDYRPGLPLHLFLMDFVMRSEGGRDLKFVSSVEQMVASRCYLASQGAKKLGCISCHDPHRAPAPAEKVAFYRQRCLQCHTEKSCGLPPVARREKNKQDSCIACHMPPTGSEVSHTSITDHRIPRRAEKPAQGVPARRSFPGPSALVPFHRDLIDLKDEEVSRNLGLALMGMLDRGPPESVARQFAEKALPLLEAALKRDRHDVPLLEARGGTLWCLGREEEALAAYELALSEKPESETALHGAGKLALVLERLETSRSYLERAIRVNPWRWQYHHLLAAAYFQDEDWERAARACRQSLRLEPFSSTARRKLLVECYLRLGQKGKARAEFDTLLQLSPPDRRADLRRWFAEQPQ
jgi:predicted CXXCH cytochrome family protein